MKLALPAGADIYLTGGKTHDSEIRLARFIVGHLSSGDCFVDVGSHFGYFTLLASKLVGATGQVVALEPSPRSFSILKQNVADAANVIALHVAASDSDEPLTFYEFPDLYSEYSGLDVKQFESQPWFQKFKPQRVQIECTTLDQVIGTHQISPAIIKIDVEGAELRVVKGAERFLSTATCIIAMEYLNSSRGNMQHRKAKELLDGFGYKPHVIDSDGTLSFHDGIDNYLDQVELESDNIIFVKP